MNKEQHEKLVKYEQIFRTAINSNYYRSMDSRFAADFIAMCQELHVYIKPSCPLCVLNALKTVGKLYFEYKEPVEEPKEPMEELVEEPVEEPKEPMEELVEEPVEEPKEPIEEKPIQDTQKSEDEEIITKTNKVSQKSQKQSKKNK